MVPKPSRRDEYDQLAVMVPLLLIFFMFYRVKEEESKMAGWWTGFWVYFFIICGTVVAIIITVVTTFIDDAFDSRPSFHPPRLIAEEKGYFETLFATGGVLIPFVLVIIVVSFSCAWLYNCLFGYRGQPVRQRVVRKPPSSVPEVDDAPRDWAKSRAKVIGAHIAFKPPPKVEQRRDFGHIAKAPGKSFVSLSPKSKRRKDRSRKHQHKRLHKHPSRLFTDKKHQKEKKNRQAKKTAKDHLKRLISKRKKGHHRKGKVRSKGSHPRETIQSIDTMYVEEPTLDQFAFSDLSRRKMPKRGFIEVSNGDGYGSYNIPPWQTYGETIRAEPPLFYSRSRNKKKKS